MNTFEQLVLDRLQALTEGQQALVERQTSVEARLDMLRDDMNDRFRVVNEGLGKVSREVAHHRAEFIEKHAELVEMVGDKIQELEAKTQ